MMQASATQVCFVVLLFAALCAVSESYGNCGVPYWTESPVVGKPFTIFFPNTYQQLKHYFDIEAPGSREGNFYTPESIPGVNYIQLNYDSPGQYYIEIYYGRYEVPYSNLNCYNYMNMEIEVSGSISAYGGLLPTTYRTSPFDNQSFMYGVNSTTSFSVSSTYDNQNTVVSPSTYNDAHKNNGLWIVHYPPFDVNSWFQVSFSTPGGSNRIFNDASAGLYSDFGPTNLQRQYTLDIERPGAIRFNAYSVSEAFVSYNLSRDEIPCQVKSIDINDQVIVCPPPRHSGPVTDLVIARFEFHNSLGFESEVYSQILIRRI